MRYLKVLMSKLNKKYPEFSFIVKFFYLFFYTRKHSLLSVCVFSELGLCS